MFSVADMAIAGVAALILFGPDQLPKVARKAGQLVRDVQNTSQSFIRELERAADDHETPKPATGELLTPEIPDTIAPLIHEPVHPEPVRAEPIAHPASAVDAETAAHEAIAPQPPPSHAG